MNKTMDQLAYNLINKSLKLEAGQILMIRSSFEAKPLVKKLMKEANRIGCDAFYEIEDDELIVMAAKNNSKEFWEKKRRWIYEVSKDCEATIKINTADFNEIRESSKSYGDMQVILRNGPKIKREKAQTMILTYPTDSVCQKFKKSRDEMMNYWLDVSDIDFETLEKATKPLEELMKKTDRVKIIAPGTNLNFSIKNSKNIICCGRWNMPDGEIFTVPVQDSVNGKISYNIESPYFGIEHQNVVLEFKEGKIINYSGTNKKVMDHIFSTDYGAKYIGEFAIGINPKITKPVCDILFDEKIHGSIHFTPGGYEMVDGVKNMSKIHWDLVLMLNKEMGGGEIYFDDILVQKDGMFVLEELKNLNVSELLKNMRY